MPLPYRPGPSISIPAQPIPPPSPTREATTAVVIPSSPPPTVIDASHGSPIPDPMVPVDEPASFTTPTVKPVDISPTDAPAVDTLEKESNIPGTFEPDEEPFFRNLDLERGLGDLNFERDFAQWFNPASDPRLDAAVALQPTTIEKSSTVVGPEPQAVPSSPVVSERAVQPVIVPSPEPPLRATFISDNNISDGHLLPPGAEFVKSWKMLNDGVRDWPETTQLIFVAGDKLVSDDNTVVKVGKVAAGEEMDIWTGDMKVRLLFVNITVCVSHVLQAPEVPGKYVSYWRLNDGNGNHFGHSLWAEYVALLTSPPESFSKPIYSITVSEPHNSSDEEGALSSSSLITMPQAAPEKSSAPSVGPVRLAAATVVTATTDTLSDVGSDDSDLSIVDVPSSPSLSSAHSDAFEDPHEEPAPPPSVPAQANNNAVAANNDFVVVYETETDDD